jgi:hypothetical protein
MQIRSVGIDPLNVVVTATANKLARIAWVVLPPR